jgi:ABC-type bacteriocin/lantibiotic exporter with double-glycine peptidase domain
MKLLEVKLKTNKKTPYVAIKVKYYRFVFVSEETNNDFEELTNAGFGIFGAVGSGKSSVLKPLVLFYTDGAFK